jgi:hypothetical protein
MVSSDRQEIPRLTERTPLEKKEPDLTLLFPIFVLESSLTCLRIPALVRY